MKRIKMSLYILAMVFTFVSCDSFLTYEPSDSINDATAFNPSCSPSIKKQEKSA